MAQAATEFELEDTAVAARPVAAPKPVKPLARPSAGPSPFEVSLTTYPMQPWHARNADLSQWFNYGLNPSTWSKYAHEQTQLWAAQTGKGQK